MDFSASTHVDTGVTQEKFRPPVRPLVPQQEAAAASQSVAEGGGATGLSWLRNAQGDVKISKQEGEDSLVLSATTNVTLERTELGRRPIVTAIIDFAKDQLTQYRGQTLALLAGAYEETYRKTFDPNKLVANVADWTIDMLLDKLVRFGMSSDEIKALRGEVKEQLKQELNGQLCELVKNRALGEVVA